MKHLKLPTRRRYIFIAGLLIATLCILGIRFVTYSKPAHTHYHANFSLFINGERTEFKASHYYEEVAACSAEGTLQPAQRAHMHDEINSVIHVHDDAVTWQQLFNNIGWTLGADFIVTDTRKMYLANETDKLNIVLNGQNLTDLTSIANQTIKDEDRLLLSFGNIDDATLAKEYKTVATTAHKYNITPDPASCAGALDKVTFTDRLKHLF